MKGGDHLGRALRRAHALQPRSSGCPRALPACCRSQAAASNAAAGRCRARTFATSPRETSFWAQSYPASAEPFVPAVPPAPSSLAPPHLPAPSAVVGREDEGRKKERYLHSLMDKAGELSLKCSVLDEHGNWTAEEGRYRKMDLCRAHDLDPRDLRKLDSLTPNLVPLIVTRRTCILISILHIRALIKPDRVIVFNSPGSTESPIQRHFMWHLEQNVRAGLNVRACADGAGKSKPDDDDDEVGLAYEHRALESILVSTANALEEEMAFTRKAVQDLLTDLETDVNRDNLGRLLHYSRRLVGFQSRAKYVKRAVEEVLESDEDLSAMYITAKRLGRPRAVHDHEQLELLLESFVKQVEEIVSEVDTTAANMNSTQEVAELMLDSGRNALIALDVKVHMATLGLTAGALVAGLFGMNLSTELETHPHAFMIVVGGAGVLVVVIFLQGLRIIRRVRHIALGAKPVAPSVGTRLWDSVSSGKIASGTAAAQALPSEHERRWALFRRSAHAKASLWDRLFRRKLLARRLLGLERLQWSHMPPHARGHVWINVKADEARARDAQRHWEMQKSLADKAAFDGSHPWAWKEAGGRKRK